MRVDQETLWMTEVCARRRGFEGSAGVFASSLNAERLFDVASRHKCVALLHSAFASGEAEAPQSPWKEKFAKTAASRRAVQSWIMDEGSVALAALEAEGIPAITMKGPGLSLQLWGDPHAREFRDLDVMVPQEDFSRAVTIMLARGFVIAADKIRNEDFASWLNRAVKLRHMSFRKKGLPVYIEIHGRSAQSLLTAPFGFDEVWNTSVCVEGGGYRFRTLETGRHGVYVLIHGAEHSWCQLHWVLDSFAFLSRFEQTVHPQIDTKVPEHYTFLDPIATAGVFGALVKNLGLAPIPPYLVAYTRQTADAEILARLAVHNFADAGLNMSDPSNNRRYRAVFLRGLTRGYWRRFMRVAGDFLRPNDIDIQYFARLHLPYSAYYFLRPLLFFYRMLSARLGGRHEELRL